MVGLQLKAVQSNHPHLQQLIKQLDQYLLELYPPEEVFGLEVNDSKIEEVQFVVAYYDGNAVGCGAITELAPNVSELKRFYVLQPYRNRGIASAMLQYLEREAVKKHHIAMRLETGDQQEEAISFYRKNGYSEIEAFGPYVGCNSSICMEKRISR